jgi:hypothetical protein
MLVVLFFLGVQVTGFCKQTGSDQYFHMITSIMPLSNEEKSQLEKADNNLSQKWNDTRVGGVGNYFGSRALDFCDILTLDLGGGIGIEPHVQITRWCQVGLGGRIHGRWAGFMSPFWEWKRQWGFYTEKSAEFAILPFSFEYCEHQGETVSMEPYIHKKSGLNMPSEQVYKSARDFWAITAGYGGILMILPVPGLGVDAKVDFHPVEFADFFAGWFGADISNDDSGKGWGFRGKLEKGE